jgi:hypothetical protein
MSFAYAPFYCEENIYRLASARLETIDDATDPSVVFISNASRQVLLLEQRAGQGALGVVAWDYHVVYEEEGRLFDLDTRLPCPADRRAWLEATFPSAILSKRPELAPRFAVVPAREFVRAFSSDRRHMRTSDGTFRKPPPEWPAPYSAARGHNLDEFIDGSHAAVARLLDLATMRAMWS